jgi:secreted PhoX family phosphatase
MSVEPRANALVDAQTHNESTNPEFDQVLSARLSRRALLRGTAGAAGVGFMTATGLTQAAPNSAHQGPLQKAALPQYLSALGFAAVAKSTADRISLAQGYDYQIIYALGDPLNAQTPAFKNDGTDADFHHRAGDHHDGMEWFGLSTLGRPSNTHSTRGLLAINHEATTDEKLTSFFLHTHGGAAVLPRLAVEVDKELDIHGLSVVEIEARQGQWSYKKASHFNRRVTVNTEVQLHGPLRGSHHAITQYSKSGTKARGTLNNCGTGKTPWGTFLSGEENWNGYFFRDTQDDQRRGKDSKEVAGLNRYGRKAGAASRHGWESASADDKHVRWNNGALGASATQDFRNEMNTFGYVVEMDAYNPLLQLRKRSAMGRFAHESVSFAKTTPGHAVVAYMGDDARFEYIYKYVSDAKWDPKDARAADKLAVGDKYLNKGTLYVARLHDTGAGEWLELSLANPMIGNNTSFEFKTEADIVVYTRIAADAVGATKMDRPEWGGVNPKNGEIYITLTNNSARTSDNTDAANPRAYLDLRAGKSQKGNVNGHIIRLGEAKPTDTVFKWDVYVFSGEAASGDSNINLSNLTDANDMSCPDGLVFSPSTGICWIQTDDSAYTDETNCMLLAAIPGHVGDGSKKTVNNLREDGSSKDVQTHMGKEPTETNLKRFLVGPRDCEITGWAETPDGRAIFINIQHPGEGTKMADVGDPSKFTSQWPSNDGYGAGHRPRSATIVITKKDGGVIGS